MATFIETGHTKNVANFKTLISFIKAYNEKYNPSNADITVPNMETQLYAADAAVGIVQVKKTAWQNAVAARIQEFKNLKPFATQIMGAFQSSGVEDKIVENARAINRKLQGVRAPGASQENLPILEEPAKDGTKAGGNSSTPETTVKKTISSSRQSFDSLVEHFSSLIELASQTPAYAPNEEELKVANLIAKKQALVTANNNIIAAGTNISNARIARNNIMYSENTGLIYVAKAAKNYIKSVYKTKSEEFKQVSGIAFKKITKD